MKLDRDNLENIVFDYFDQIKLLISPVIWENVLLDCSKNELLILMLLYRSSQVNMTRIAEYVQVPLNTVTGIVDRMERKKMVCRQRSKEDKRVVTIELAEYGRLQFQSIIKEILYYMQKLVDRLTIAEGQAVGSILDKAIEVFHEGKPENRSALKKKIRKITIE